MKILIISEYFYPDVKGGGELSCFLLAKALVKAGVDVSVLTSHLSEDRFVVFDGIKVHRLLTTGKDPKKMQDNLKRHLFFEKSLRKELPKLQEEFNYDIIHCMNVTSSAAIELKEQVDAKFVLHVNSPVLFCPKGTLMFQDKEPCSHVCSLPKFDECYAESTTIGKMEDLNPIKKTFFKPIIRKRFLNYVNFTQGFDAFMPISKYMQELLMRYKIPKKKTKVIYNIIDFTKFLNLKKPNNEVPKILYLGPYTKPKGAFILLKALSKMKEEFVGNYYGSGVLKEELETFIKNTGINVTINDPVPYEQVPKLMEEHDIVVVPSLVGEALGRVCLEAGIAGKPVVAFNIGGIPDIIKDGENGFLVEPGESGELGKKIDYIIHNYWVPHEIEVLNLQYKFSEETIVKKVIEVYEWALKE